MNFQFNQSVAGHPSQRGGLCTIAKKPKKSGTIKVLIVDEQSIVRRGCRSILDAQAGIQVVDEASTGAEAIAKARAHYPHVVVLDPAMAGGSGVETTRALGNELPHCRVLAMTALRDAAYVRNTLLAGAKGYLLKDASDEDLIEAVLAVGDGRSYLSTRISDAVLADYKQYVKSPLELLTSREREVLRLLAEGRTNKDVANLLNLSVHTVDAHRGAMMEKLGLHGIGDIVRFAMMRNGVIT